MTAIEMRRTSLQFFKDRNTGDSSQIPASGATYAVFRQGATVSAAATFYSSSTVRVSVYSLGRIRLGDALQLGRDPSKIFSIGNLDANGTWLDLQYADSTFFQLQVGDRLIPLYSPPALYSDSLGTTPLASNVVTLDSGGRASFFCREARHDALLANAGPTRLILDSEGGWLRGGLGVYNAKDYPSVQEAVDACPSGGTVYIPSGIYTMPSGGLVIAKALELFGDGPNSTVLNAFSSATNQPVIKIAVSAGLNSIRIRDLHLGNPSSTSRVSGCHGISCIAGSSILSELRLERVNVTAMADDGIHIEGVVVFLYVVGVETVACWGNGFYIRSTTVGEMHNCYANGNQLNGAFCRASQVAWYSCAFENNCLLTPTVSIPVRSSDSVAGVTNETNVDLYSLNDGIHPINPLGAQLRMRDCAPARVESCDFENFGDLGTASATIGGPAVRFATRAVYFKNCQGSLITNCGFFNFGNETDATAHTKVSTGFGIYVDEGGYAQVMTNQFTNIMTPVHVESGAVGSTVAPQAMNLTPAGPQNNPPPVTGTPALLGAMGTALLAQASVGTPTTPVPAAAGQLYFDLSSTALMCWDGTRWRSQTEPVPVKLMGDQTIVGTTLAPIAPLFFNLVGGVYHHFRFVLLVGADQANVGLQIALTFPSTTAFGATVTAIVGGQGPAATWTGAITSSGVAVTTSGVPNNSGAFLVVVEGSIKLTGIGVGTLQVSAASVVTGHTVKVKDGSYGFLTILP